MAFSQRTKRSPELCVGFSLYLALFQRPIRDIARLEIVHGVNTLDRMLFQHFVRSVAVLFTARRESCRRVIRQLQSPCFNTV